MRKGLSLLELVIVAAIMAALVTAAANLMRTSRIVWTAYEGDVARLEAANGTLLHLLRELRQCSAITAISAPSTTAGSLSATGAAGNTLVWALSGNNVMFGAAGSADDLLAEGLTELRFVGYAGDGTTATTVVADIRSVECIAVVTLDRDTSATQTVSCRAWLRAW